MIGPKRHGGAVLASWPVEGTKMIGSTTQGYGLTRINHQLAVVMPHAGYSRYCNMYWGADYFDFLTEERRGLFISAISVH